MNPKSNERIEQLGSHLKIIISDKFNFTSDSIILAEFSNPSSKYNVLEIGSGCGIIPLIWCKNKKAKNIIAVEINKQACDMFSRSILINNLKDKIHIINKDILEYASSHNIHNKFDMAVCNPPYSKLESTKPCKNVERSLARHENEINIEQIIKASSILLKNGGYLCLCCRTERLCDVIFNMRKYNVEPKFLQFVEYKKGYIPGLFLIKGKRNSKPGIIVKSPYIL